MCGIAGKLYFDPGRPAEREVLERMNAVQVHRGPDDAGIYCQGPVGLAHRRLSIIDHVHVPSDYIRLNDGRRDWRVGPREGHPNEKANRKFAEEIARVLRDLPELRPYRR